MEKVETQTPLAIFRPPKLQVPTKRLGSIERQPFQFVMGSRLVQKLGSLVEGSKNPTTQTNTLEFLEKVIVKVLQVALLEILGFATIVSSWNSVACDTTTANLCSCIRQVAHDI